MARKFIPRTSEDFEHPLISELVHETFQIQEIMFDESVKGPYALVTTDVIDKVIAPDGIYRTSAGVLPSQLEKVQAMLEDDPEPVEVKLIKAKGKEYDYYSFGDFGDE